MKTNSKQRQRITGAYVSTFILYPYPKARGWHCHNLERENI